MSTKRACFSPVWLACLGVAWLTLPATAALTEVRVVVQDSAGVVLPDAVVMLKGQPLDGKPVATSPAIFSVVGNKVEFAVSVINVGSASASFVLPPDQSPVKLVFVLSGDSGRVLLAGDANSPGSIGEAILEGMGEVAAQPIAGHTWLTTYTGPVHAGSGSPAGPGGCVADTILTHQTAPGTFDEGASVACGVAGSHTVENFYAQSFVVPAGGGDLECVDFVTSQQTVGTYTVNVNIYEDTNGGDPNTGNMLLLGTTTVDLPLDDIGIVSTADFSGQGIALTAGMSVVFEIHAPDRDAAAGGDGGQFRVGASGLAADGPSFFYAASCGLLDYGSVAAIGFPNSQWMYNLGLSTGPPPPPACGVAGTGDCNDPAGTGSPFCDDLECCLAGCALDSFCCDVEWDGLCATNAAALPECQPPPPGDTCDDCISVDASGATGDTSDNGVSGVAPSCGGGGSPDEWLCYTGCDGSVTIDTFGSGYDTVLAVFAACGGAEIACNDDSGGGLQSSVSFPTSAGTVYYIRVGGFSDNAGPYVLNITENCGGGDDCPAFPVCGSGGACNDPNGVPGCDDVACCCAVCTADAFCCDVGWDGLCTGAAEVEPACQQPSECDINFPVCAGASGDCGSANGTPGCDNEECCCAGCAADGFCCEVEWDGACAAAAGGFPECAGAPCALNDAGDENCQPYALDNASQSNSTAFTSADNFSVAADADITSICWWGAYIPSPGPDSFVVTYYDDLGGIPNSVIGGPFAQGAGLTVLGPFDTGDLVADTAPIWEYSGSHAPVAVGAGSCYWIEIKNDPAGTTWFWEWSHTGDNYTMTDAGPNGYDAGDVGTPDHDFSWCINSATSACDLATGACCDGNANCTIQTEADCLAAGSTYNGDGTDCSSDGATTLFDSGAINVGIPDNLGGVGTHTINVAPAGGVSINDIDIVLNIAHSWVGDLCITVEHLGTSVIIVQRIGDGTGLGCDTGGCCGCSADNITGECNDEGGDGSINDACPPSGGSYIPENALSAWDGMELAGDWTITIVDNAGGDVGTLNSWGIEHNEAGAPPCEEVGACCCVVGTDCSVGTQDDCEAAGGNYLGDGTNCGGGGGPVSVESASGLGLGIPDGSPGAGVTHQLVMADSFPIQDLDIDVQITHTWVGDLRIEVEHLGVTAIIVNQPGDATDTDGGPFGCAEDNYDIILDDEGTGGTIEDLCLVGMTSPPNYTPNGALSVFDNMDSAGAWNITVFDTAAADTGTLDGWSVHAQDVDAGGGGVCEFECSECGNGVVEDGEDCDDGNTEDGDCCSSTCLHDGAGTNCGDGANECSGQDTCDGAGNCDANDSDAGTDCGDGPNECSGQDTCDGSGGCTNANDSDAGTNCGAGATECSGQDTCDGGGNCSANDSPSGTACGDPGDECAAGDACTGGGVCQPGVVIVDCINDDGCCAVGCVNENDNDCPLDVPTVSTWGLAILALLLLAGSKVYFGRRRQTA